MQTIKQPTANQQPGITLLPQKQKAVNKTVSPINTDTKATNPTQFNGLQPTTDAEVQNTGMTMTSLPQTTGLLGVQSNTAQPTTTQTGAATGVPQTEFKPAEYQSNGYTGVQGETNEYYDPRSESLVKNQITGLLDPNSALMRKAIAQAQGYSASRGLQSSSIGNEVALSSMIDKALPIAQQDAQTYGQADQLGWQNNFTAEQNNLSRQHDSSMFDKQGQLNMALQNQQLAFQNNQANADRQNQSYQLERNAQLNEKRDQLLQQFQSTNMNKEFLNQLEMKSVEFQQQDSMFEKQVNAQTALDYRNATSSSYNSYLEQVANVYSNPNMTPQQQAAGVAKLDQMFNQQRIQLQTIYDIVDKTAAPNNSGGAVPPNQNTGPLPVNPTPPNMGVVNPGGGGGRGGSGSIKQPQVMR
jgi:hypothetical protein